MINTRLDLIYPQLDHLFSGYIYMSSFYDNDSIETPLKNYCEEPKQDIKNAVQEIQTYLSKHPSENEAEQFLIAIGNCYNYESTQEGTALGFLRYILNYLQNYLKKHPEKDGRK